MKKTAKRECLPLLLEAARATGRPRFSWFAREHGYSESTIRKWWKRELGGSVENGEARLGSVVQLAPPGPSPDTLEPEEFWRGQVKILSRALRESLEAGALNASTGLARQLGEAFKELQTAKPNEADATTMGEVEYRGRLVLAFQSAPSEHIEELIRVYQGRTRAALLIPCTDGGASMILTDDGWKREGPPIPWSESFHREE